MKRLFLSTAFFALTSVSGMAGVPTIDVTSIAQLKQLLAESQLQFQQQIQENLKLDEQIAQANAQIAQLKSQLDALTLGLDLSDLGIDGDFLEGILPKIDGISDGLASAKNGDWGGVFTTGKVGSKSVDEYVTGVFKDAGIEKADVDTLAESEKPAQARIGAEANTGAFLSAAAEASSEDASESLRRIEALVQKIPDTGNLKSALDLNTRVTAELGIALGNIWNMEAVQTVGQGEAGVMDAATAADEEKYLRIGAE